MNINSAALLILLNCVFLLGFKASSQNNLHIKAENRTFIFNDNSLPFWLHANQFGQIEQPNQYLNLFNFLVHQETLPEEKRNLHTFWGSNIVAALGSENNYFQLSELFSGINFKGWEIQAGIFHDPVHYSGLSTSNGNFARSNNARSYPRIRISNPNYKPLPFLRKWLLFKAEYDEGILNDNRYVENTHLHHKSIYFLIKPQNNWDIQLGLEHFVMWGGTSKNEDIGKLPTKFKNYLRYIFSQPGDEDSPIQEKLNIAGNQLGTYQFKFTKRFTNQDVILYLSHPFENHKGVNLRNWRDNVLGFYIKKADKQGLINAFNYEFTYTKDQAIRDSLYISNTATGNLSRQSFENYFSHSIYKSGYTYYRRILGSPLFFPITREQDESTTWYAIQSTRLVSHHLGFLGYVSEKLKWKGMITYIEHYGTYTNPYSKAATQLSGLLEVQYNNTDFPVELGVSGAFDFGSSINKKLGLMISVAKKW